jgi:hypothetical protein
MTTPEIIHTHPLTEEMLAAHRDHARGDDKGYRASHAGAPRARAVGTRRRRRLTGDQGK